MQSSKRRIFVIVVITIVVIVIANTLEAKIMSQESGAGRASGTSEELPVNVTPIESSEGKVTDIPIGMPIGSEEFRNLKREAQQISSQEEAVEDDNEEKKSSDTESL